MDVPAFYNKHYIETDKNGMIVDAWSNGPLPQKDIEDAICINDQGGYQFRFEDGEENPPLYTIDRIPLYRWDGEQVLPRTDAEIEADRALLPTPEPVKSPTERLDAIEAAIERGLSL